MPMLVKAALILVATVLIPAAAANAIKATTRAYSIRSCPFLSAVMLRRAFEVFEHFRRRASELDLAYWMSPHPYSSTSRTTNLLALDQLVSWHCLRQASASRFSYALGVHSLDPRVNLRRRFKTGRAPYSLRLSGQPIRHVRPADWLPLC